VDALDRLGLTGPVDWVGNAWGGHVGIQLAAHHRGRIRTLTTIGTPVQGLSARERWLMCWPLVALYRVAGPNPLLLKALSDALLGGETIAAQPDRAAAVIGAFAAADRAAMFHAMRSMMLHRPTMARDVTTIDIPVLMLAAREDPMGWRPADAHAIAATMPDARVGDVAGSGHVAPLLIDAENVVDSVVGLWQSVP
jgi:pimeloyl-ACP methyl ester carboxylesterase